jgi:PAS domain S-box-containing protein
MQPIPSIQKSEADDLTNLFEFAPELLAVLAPDGTFLRVNQAGERTLGRERTSLLGVSFLRLIHPDDTETATRRFVRAVQEGARVSFRSRCTGDNGRLRWIQWDLSCDSTREQIYAIARDVTNQQVAEKELARANEILGTVLVAAPLPIWASDPEGRIQFWNDAAEKVLGWTSDEIFNGEPPDQLPNCGGPEGKQRLTGEKMPWRSKDGSVRQLRFWTSPLHDNGIQCGTLGMTVDVTEYDAEVYEALERAYNDLRDTRDAVMQQERLRVLGQMASGIAHDINNALSPVKLYVQLLTEGEFSMTSEGRSYLKTIQKAIEDVAETVARIREFYRTREPQATLVPVSLNDLVDQVLELTRPRWRDIPLQMGIVIKTVTDLARDLPLAWGIESEIREALTNLIFNAVDAMPSGGTLTIRTGAVTEQNAADGPSPVREIYTEVADTGAGMDEATCRRCLEPFFTTKGERGTGLGLATVYGAMQRNSGAIDIQSALGEGTTMRLRFGVARAAKDAVAENSTVRPAVPSPRRVLVVDDDPLVAQALRDTLERDGHQVVTAEGGEAGIEVFRAMRKENQPFDLVLTDLGMPYVDGRRVASVVKTESPSTAVVLLTGWGRRIVADRDVPPNVDGVLSKPPDLNEIRNLLAACSATEEARVRV